MDSLIHCASRGDGYGCTIFDTWTFTGLPSTLVAEPLGGARGRTALLRGRFAASLSSCPTTSSMAWSLRGNGWAGGSAFSARDGTPAPSLSPPSGGTDIDRNVSFWDGCAQTFEEFEENAELFCASCEDSQLTLLGPWIARAHAAGSKQRSISMALTVETLCGRDSPQKILAGNKALFSDKPEGEVWTHVQKYVFGGQCKRFSSMTEYIVAEGVLHERASKSLRTVKWTADDETSTSAADANDAVEAKETQFDSVFPEPLRALLLLEKSQ